MEAAFMYLDLNICCPLHYYWNTDNILDETLIIETFIT